MMLIVLRALLVSIATLHLSTASSHPGRPSRALEKEQRKKKRAVGGVEYQLSGLSDESGGGGGSASSDDAASIVSSGGSCDTTRAAQTSLFAAALAVLPGVRDPLTGEITTEGFVNVCELTIPIIDSFGPAFGMVSRDIRANIARLRRRAAADPERYRLLSALVDDDVKAGDLGPRSCVKAALWLKRGMEFMLAVTTRAAEAGAPREMRAVVAEQYARTLKRWHGFVASSAFNVALNFVPNRRDFLDRLAGGRFTRASEADLLAYAARFGALLADVHAALDARGLDDPAKV